MVFQGIQLGKMHHEHRGTDPSARGVNMDDILIVSSNDSETSVLWADYFTNCFEQYSKQKSRPVPKILRLGLEDIISGSDVSQSLLERISSVKLQLLIVCPKFLKLVEDSPIPSSTFGKCLRPDRTIAMLLGVTDDVINDLHHAALPNYRQWQRHVVGQDQDENFTKDFLTAAINILTKVARQEQQQAIEERTTFSVMPKKVKQSQNRLIILLAEPLTPSDTIKVSVDKNGEMLEIRSVKRRNPYTLKFAMPEQCLEVSLIVNVLVEKNGDLLGARPVKCESRLRELDQILRSSDSPLEFMCQTLGFSPSCREQLDHWMVHNFQKNVPPHFNLLATSGHSLDTPQSRHLHAHEEYPTLLHFAARFGLEKLAWQLLECPGGDMAIDVRNVCDLTPAEMAEGAGHGKLASSLSGYMQMNEFSNMYSKLKEMAQRKSNSKPECEQEPEVDEDEYLVPRAVEQETYSIPPPAKPITPSASSKPITGYLEMQPSNHNTSSNKGTLSRKQDNESGFNFQSTSRSHRQQSVDSSDSCSTSTNPHKYEDKVQGELLEIMNDFKNNVFSIAEVEVLVEKWRNRNDVQNSFKDKQEQINFLREEYDRVQQMIKEQMKRPTPFDRIKKLFSWNKKEETMVRVEKCDNSSVNSEDKIAGYLPTGNLRPISSLSLQSTASTSSSGRMSTISGCSAASFGDSGTHSDHEERKHLMRQASNASEHEYFEINDQKKSNSHINYLVPPAPKPVYRPTQLKPLNFAAPQFSTINERPPHPVPRVDTSPSCDLSEHYIQFPPSGLPVNGGLAAELKAQLKLRAAHTPSPVPTPDDSEYLLMEQTADQPEYVGEEPFQEYINVVNEPITEVDYETTDEVLPEYMNLTISPELPPRAK